MERAEVRDFVRKHRKDSPGWVEHKLWDIAELAPLGGYVVGELDDPYLLRIYVSPRGPQFKWLWAKARKYVGIGEYRARQYANEVGTLIEQLHPRTWALFMNERA